MAREKMEIDGPRFRKAETKETPLIEVTLDARDWRTICRHWEFYDAARPYGDQDERWRDSMRQLYRYVDKRTAAANGPVTLPGSFLGYAYATWWAESVARMGAARDLSDVMVRMVPQVVEHEPARGAEVERDD
jgi:hypothetical protein